MLEVKRNITDAACIIEDFSQGLVSHVLTGPVIAFIEPCQSRADKQIREPRYPLVIQQKCFHLLA